MRWGKPDAFSVNSLRGGNQEQPSNIYEVLDVILNKPKGGESVYCLYQEIKKQTGDKRKNI